MTIRATARLRPHLATRTARDAGDAATRSRKPRAAPSLGGDSCPRILISATISDLARTRRNKRASRIPRPDARAQGATTLITTGAVQFESPRHDGRGRVCRGHAVRAGADGGERRSCDRRQPVLDKLYGATIRLVPSIDPMLAVGQDEAVVAEVAAGERAAGRVPYVIPVGGSSGVGVCGYIGGSAELVDQLADAAIEPSRLYYASGSRGTQAGLTFGAKLCEAPYQAYGVAVSAGEPEKIERAKRIANEAAALLKLPERLELSDLVTDQNFIGEATAFQQRRTGSDRALRPAEALLLDPVHAKAAAAMIRHIRDGEIHADETVGSCTRGMRHCLRKIS